MRGERSTETVRVRAPEIAAGEWLNTDTPIQLAAQRGRAVLVHIWDFTCLNCLRSLPYLTAWHRAYRHLPVTFVGVHTPEFEFAKESRQVAAALDRHGVGYPVVLDNEQRTWEAFANRYWPTIYLIDAAGYIRYQHAGEGRYAETEAALVGLAGEAEQGGQAGALSGMGRPVGVLRDEDHPGAVCFRTTPELHAGYNQGALGNPEGYAPRGLPLLYQLPPRSNWQDGFFYVEGTWQAGTEHLALAGEQGTIVLPYHAASANAVLAPAADPVALRLDLEPPVKVEVTQDGAPLEALAAGEDVVIEAGRSYVVVDAPRMYSLARNPDASPHVLRLNVPARGLAAFAFSFSTCVQPRDRPHKPPAS
jgi:thiol-disulfide isomerase/thioredoxin